MIDAFSQVLHDYKKEYGVVRFDFVELSHAVSSDEFLRDIKPEAEKQLAELVGKNMWSIKCKRCPYGIVYKSPGARLVGMEIKLGFDGK